MVITASSYTARKMFNLFMKNLQFGQTSKTNDALPECLCVVHPALEEGFFSGVFSNGGIIL